MTALRQLVLERAITKSIELLREAVALASELRVTPSEAMWALLPSPES